MPTTRAANPSLNLTDLSQRMGQIFQQAQESPASHQKNSIALHGLLSNAARHKECLPEGGMGLTGEHAFQKLFFGNLLHVLPLKKSIKPADMIAKFVGDFVGFIQRQPPEDRTDNDDELETPASRFTTKLFELLLRGFLAKDNGVRYQTTRMTTRMILRLGELDDDVYDGLREGLLGRLQDKEVSVRVQAVISLSKLSCSERIDDLRHGEQLLEETLMQTLGLDPSSEVRRNVLANIPLNNQTLHAILSRTRDKDPTIRKLVYSEALRKSVSREDGSIDVAHPSSLAQEDRELIARNGLGDPVQVVREAAASLMSLWADLAGVAVAQKTEPGEGEVHPESETNKMIFLLEMFDLREGLASERVARTVLATRHDIVRGIKFNDDYWGSLTPESAFLARVLVDHCAKNDKARLEAILPVVTEVADTIRDVYEDHVADLRDRESDDLPELHNFSNKSNSSRSEAIAIEMLKLAVRLDYSDELGRKKMRKIMCEILSNTRISEKLMNGSVDVVLKLSSGQRYFIQVMLETVQRLGQVNVGKRDGCLALCIAMLERVNIDVDNGDLNGMVERLIFPSATRKEEKGMRCLGLLCLTSERFALRFFDTFMREMEEGTIKIIYLHAFFDILTVHGPVIMTVGDNTMRIQRLVVELLKTATDEKLQAIIAMGIAKLVYSRVINAHIGTKALIIAYFNPDTSRNLQVRQSVSRFLDFFSTETWENKKVIREIYKDTFQSILDLRKGINAEIEVFTMSEIGEKFVEWTHPRKILNQAQMSGMSEGQESAHIDMAMSIVTYLFSDMESLKKEDRKALCRLLGTLHIPEKVDDLQIKMLDSLMRDLQARRPVRDNAAKNLFDKFHDSITKKFANQLEGLNDEDIRNLQQYQDLFDVSVVKVQPEQDQFKDVSKKNGRKRKLELTLSTSMEVDNDEESRPNSQRQRKEKSKYKRRRRTSRFKNNFAGGSHGSPAAAPKKASRKYGVYLNSPEAIKVSSDSDEDQPKSRTQRPPSRKYGVSLNSPEVIEISSDSDEDQPTSRSRTQRPPVSAIRRAKQGEMGLDGEMPGVPHVFRKDSDSADAKEEEDVNNLLLANISIA